MKRGLTLAAFAFFVAVPSAGSFDRDVTIPGKFFSPSHRIVLIGDTVTWRNGDSSAHTVTANDVSFDSGVIPPGGSFSRSFSIAGVYVYHCTIHRYMRAEVDVYGLALSAPGYAVPVGVQTALKGLAPPGTGEVTLGRQEAGGFETVGTASVAADGSFRFPLTAETPGVYRAETGSLTSGAVTLAVAARLKLSATRKASSAQVIVRSDPRQPHASVQLQTYVLERFDFLPLRRGRLDAEGKTVFHITVRDRLHLRAFLPTGVNGFGRAFSPTLVVRRG